MESLRNLLLKGVIFAFVLFTVGILVISLFSVRNLGSIYSKNYLFITSYAGKGIRYVLDIYSNDYLIYQNLESIKHRIDEAEAVYLFFKGKSYQYPKSATNYSNTFKKCLGVKKEKLFFVDDYVLVCYPLYEELASELLKSTQKKGVFAILFSKKELESVLKGWLFKNLMLLIFLFGIGLLIKIMFFARISKNFQLLGCMIRRTERFLKEEGEIEGFREELGKFIEKLSFSEFREIGDLIVSLLERVAELTHRLKEQAVVDALTGLYNRNYLEQFVNKIISFLQRHKFPLSVAMIDIDDFKLINDTFGHKKGDEVLRTLGAIVKSSIRKSDVAIRYGGEEILIIFPNTEKEYAAWVVKRIKEELRQRDFGLDRPVTFSAGIAGYPEDVDGLASLDSLIEIADKRLYLAKRKGKNRIEL